MTNRNFEVCITYIYIYFILNFVCVHPNPPIFSLSPLSRSKTKQTKHTYTYTNYETDFSPDFPREAIPDFHKELQHFRIMPNGEELVLDTLLSFCHFESATPVGSFRDHLGVPPPPPPPPVGTTTTTTTNHHHGVSCAAAAACSGVDEDDIIDDDNNDADEDDFDSEEEEEDAVLGDESELDIRRRITKASISNGNGPLAGGGGGGDGPDEANKHGMKKKASKTLSFSQIQWIGE